MNGHKIPRPQLVSALVGNWVGIFGLAVAVCSLFAAFCLIAIDFFHGFRQPYMGILIYLIIPSFIWLGLMCAGVGVWLERRRRKKPAAAGPALRQVPGGAPANLSRRFVCVFFFLMFSAIRKLPRVSGD